MDATLLKSNMTKLEEKVLKTKAFIDVLNKDKAKLQELNNQIKEELQLVQEEFEDLKKVHQELVEEHNKLKMDYTFANSRVNELEKYVDEYKDNSEQLAQSIARSLDTLEDISGLEDIELLDNLNEELNAAEDYTSGSALESELLDLEDLDNN
jgi:chromosome segregation ATPase